MPVALVAGAAGFIGSHLTDRLLATGWEVVAVDDLCTGDLRNLEAAQSTGGLRFVRADVADPLPALPRFDRVFHLASPASPVDFAPLALAIVRTASEGTRRLLERAALDGARFLLASSSEVYGEPLSHPQREDCDVRLDPTSPRAVYSESKRFAETTTMAWARSRGVDVRIARIFNTYGPRMRRDDGRVVPAFVAHALAGTPLPIHGDGAQTRSLCYVDDLVDGLLALMDSDLSDPCNLGRDDERSVLALALAVCEAAGVTPRLEHLSRPVDDPSRRRPDLTRARAALDWDAHTPLAIGLDRTVAAFRERDALRS